MAALLVINKSAYDWSYPVSVMQNLPPYIRAIPTYDRVGGHLVVTI